MSILNSWWRALVALIFPPHCPVCDLPLGDEKGPICSPCLASAPLTSDWALRNNTPCDRLSVKGCEVRVVAMLKFHKAPQWRHLIHQFKYHSRWRLAREVGRLYGGKMAGSLFLSDVDWVIPMPLHPLRRMWRGYNQSEELARGIAEQTGLKVETKSVVRVRYTRSQVWRTREERSKNVQDAFRVAYPERLAGCHLLLVDDVLTTGSTMRTCIQAIVDAVPDCRISVAVLADAGGGS